MARSAKEAHEEHKQVVEKLLEKLGEKVNVLTREAKEEGIDWGHVGDMASLRQGLMDLLVSVSFEEDDDDETEVQERIEGSL